MIKASVSAVMEREMTVSVKLEAKDEVLMVPRTMVLRSAAMESRGTVSVKCEPIDEILTVPRAVVNGHYEPACHLCGCAERDIEEALGLGKEASDISADVLLANMHIKKEQEDISDQKVIADLLAVHKFCDRAEGEGEQQQQQQQDEGDGLIACRFCNRTKEEEREMMAGLLAEADSIGADVLLSDTQIKKEPQDIKDPKVTEDLLGFCKFCDIEDKELALALQPECSNVEEATRQLSGNNRSTWNVLKKCSGVCGEAVAHPAQKCTTPEDRQFVNGSGPLQVPDVNRSGGGEDSACGSYTCGSCSATFSSKYRLVRHVFVHIGGVRPPPHVCRLCGDVFRTGGSLRVHLKRGECAAVAGCSVADSAGDRRLSGTRRISPGNSLAPTVDGIEEKVEEATRQLSGKNRSMWSVLKKCSGVCGEAVAHPAQKCATPEDRQFVNGSGPLQVPDVNRSGGGEDSACGSYTCGSCSATFSSKYRLVRHVFVHIGGVRPPPHVCRLCGDVFRTGGSLRVHLKRGECAAVAGCSVADSAGDRRLSGTRRISPGNSLAPTVDGIEEKVCNRARQPSTCTGRNTQTEKSKQKHRNGDCGKSPQSAFELGQNSECMPTTGDYWLRVWKECILDSINCKMMEQLDQHNIVSDFA
ncbi:uncharacterized protein LOC126213359 [Schistocerca nitens]|uniref:uncharacterized protein LOC126213359 n=1 Tax=Schistocerca nitens TaxID=7011 RepID=UPI0021181A0B|nr:uncharacterized protein LOC126213359 [Schistocerca nitens]